MLPYAWNCRVCQFLNGPGVDACASCGSPAELTAAEIETRRAQRDGRAVVPQAQPKVGRTALTWLLIVLFCYGGVQLVWHGLMGLDTADENRRLAAYAATYGWFDRFVSLLYGAFSILIGVTLYRLRVIVIRAVWLYVGLTSGVFLLECLFRDAKRAMITELGVWPWLMGCLFWAVVLWYLYRLKHQGRLYA